jgi:hypothetical protein
MAMEKAEEKKMLEITKKNFARVAGKRAETKRSCGGSCGPCDCFGASSFYQAGGAAGGVLGDMTA